MPPTLARPRRAPAVLYDMDWPTYSHLLRIFQSRRRFRLTFDRGTLEIMSPSFEHEGSSGLLNWLVKEMITELGLLARTGESVTLRRRRKQRGLEPDCCFWIANAARLAGKRKLDLRIDPPPDLAIEVDVTNSSLDRMSIYAALGVPEVWRLTDGKLTFCLLKDGQYAEQPTSLAFPRLQSADLVPFLDRQPQTDDATIIREFRTWVRASVL